MREKVFLYSFYLLFGVETMWMEISLQLFSPELCIAGVIGGVF